MTKPNHRAISISNQDDIVAEVERLAGQEISTSGTHSFPKIVRHLAITNDVMTGKLEPPKPPWFVRMILIPLMKSSILNKPAKSGFKLPNDAEQFFWPAEEPQLQQAIADLKESAENYKKNGPLPVHPVFGKATKEQIDNLAFSHAAMHLGFVHPA